MLLIIMEVTSQIIFPLNWFSFICVMYTIVWETCIAICKVHYFMCVGLLSFIFKLRLLYVVLNRGTNHL